MWQTAVAGLLAMIHASTMAQPARSGSECELHVWPGSGLSSVYGGRHNDDTASHPVPGQESPPAKPAASINTEDQVGLLRQAGLPTLLRLPEFRLVIHENALASRTIRTSTTRIDPSSSPCYAELVVDDLFYQRDVVTGRFLKVLFRFRRFAIDPAPSQVFATWVKTKLRISPSKADTSAAEEMADLRAAFASDITLFAAALSKPAKINR